MTGRHVSWAVGAASRVSGRPGTSGFSFAAPKVMVLAGQMFPPLFSTRDHILDQKIDLGYLLRIKNVGIDVVSISQVQPAFRVLFLGRKAVKSFMFFLFVGTKATLIF